MNRLGLISIVIVAAAATVVATTSAVSCSSRSPTSSPTTGPATTTAAAPLRAAATQPASLASTWTGSATIVVQFVRQKQLPVRLVIAADGSVTGTVGDATLANATLRPGRGGVERSLGWGRDYRIHGDLQGDLVATESVRRDGVDILFDAAPDGTLVGGIHSTGSKTGGKETMIVSAGNMTLRRSRQAGANP
jgi:hypothetical protein